MKRSPSRLGEAARRLHESTTLTEALTWLARGLWARQHKDAACSPERTPDPDALAEWLPACPVKVWAEVGEVLAQRDLTSTSGLGAAASMVGLAMHARIGGAVHVGEADPPPTDGLLFHWRPRPGAAALVMGSVHELWLARPDRRRGPHPLGPLVMAWQAAQGAPMGRMTVTAARGIVRRPKAVSNLIRAPWLDAPVEAAIVDGLPMARGLPRPPTASMRAYRSGSLLRLGRGVPAVPPDWRLLTVGGLPGKTFAPDVLMVLSLSQAVDRALRLTDREGASLLAMSRDGTPRRPQASDIRRWRRAVLWLRQAVWLDPADWDWLPLAEVTRPARGVTVLAPPEWARGKALHEAGWTLTAEGGQAAMARRRLAADGGPAARIVTALEHRLAIRWDGRPGRAPDLRPARGKTGPGPVVTLDWRTVMRLTGFAWNQADPKADHAMRRRYSRAVGRILNRKAGYRVVSVRAEAPAGDAVEVVGVQRATRARPAGLRVRASARMVEAAKRSLRANGEGFEAVPLAEWLGLPKPPEDSE